MYSLTEGALEVNLSKSLSLLRYMVILFDGGHLIILENYAGHRRGETGASNIGEYNWTEF